LAVGGLVTGILATLFGLTLFAGTLALLAFLGIPLGGTAIGLSAGGIGRARRTGTGRGAAIAGLILGILGLGAGLVLLLALVPLARALRDFE